MKKLILVFMVFTFGLLPFAVTEVKTCEAMQEGMAKADACCGSDGCDCGVKTAPSHDTAASQITQNFSPGNKHVHIPTHEAATISVKSGCGCKTPQATSAPAPPDKPYQLHSQYRI